MKSLLLILALTTLTREVRAEEFWAGGVIAVSERETRDPCRFGQGFDMNLGDYTYGGWPRQRAAYTNVCFEVWMPGVTDWENPDFWRQLDVQVHYRYEAQGAFRTEYVNSVDRRGNNRRYAWDMRAHDPFPVSTAPHAIPYRELSRSTNDDGRTWAAVESTMEFYFTVNGRELRKANGWPFFIRYGEAYVLVE